MISGTHILIITLFTDSLLLDIVFICLVTSNQATGRRPKESVMTGIMTRGSADGRTLEATSRVSRPVYRHDGNHTRKRDDRFHFLQSLCWLFSPDNSGRMSFVPTRICIGVIND
jgi:hypothetical protein